MRWLIRALSAAGIVAIVASIAFAFTGAPQFDPDAACVGNAKVYITALSQYLQDYDEHYPPTSSATAFQTALESYTKTSPAFICPATNMYYALNNAIGEQAVSQFSDPSTLVVFQDRIPHRDGKSAVAYADGSVLFGGQAFGDVNTLCIQRAESVARSVLQYAEDNDQQIPPKFDSSQNLKAAIYPYLSSGRDFLCPATGQAYVPNANLSGVALTSFADQGNTVVVSDPVPHADGVRTVAYLDGHAVHASVSAAPVTDATCESNLKQIGLGVIEYLQNNDDNYPAFSNTQQLMAAVAPYIGNSIGGACPVTHDEYLSNTALSGVSSAEIAEPGNTWVIKDAVPHSDGRSYIVWADGHVSGNDAFEPKSLAILPGNNSVLLWTRENVYGGTGVILEKLDPFGRVLSQSAIEGGGSDTSATPPPVTGVVTSTEGQVALFASSEGTATMLYLNSSWAVDRSVVNGPYDGWTPTAMSIGSNGQLHLLWDRWDGVAAVWNMTTSSNYIGDVRLGPLPNFHSVTLAVAPDNTQRLLWVGPNGVADIGTLGVDGQPAGSLVLPEVANAAPIGIVGGPDDTSSVLYASGSGMAWIVMSDTRPRRRERTQTTSFPVAAGAAWQPIGFAVGSDRDFRVAYQGIPGVLVRVYCPSGELIASNVCARPSH